MKDRGVLLSTDGPFENVLKIKPPMVLTPDDVDMVLRILDVEIPNVERT
jgi:4-aminobutyrate aminotransferase-like enzyme